MAAAALPDPHTVRSDRQLYDYTQELKDRYLRKSVPLNKVCYDNTLEVIKHALGTHTAISRVHVRLKASREIRIATVFRQAPAAFLRMIVVHELAHLKEADHNKAFYQLCQHMEPDYLQLEFDTRLYLTELANRGQRDRSSYTARPLPDLPAMEPIRLDKRLSALLGIPRGEARRYRRRLGHGQWRGGGTAAASGR